MRIPRLHLFELEDFAWFPTWIRDYATDYMHFMEKRLGAHQPAVPLIAEALSLGQTNRLVDLCSGGSGPIPDLLEELKKRSLTPEVVLTDRFPNLDAFQRVERGSNGRITFRADSVDARRVPRELSGLRTLFNAFHHFQREDALAVLRDAAEAGQPIAILEIPDRRFRTLISMLVLTPLLVALVTPFIRPFRWNRLFWTYIIPLVEITCWWDGSVSQLRAYSAEELRELGETADSSQYEWKAGQVRIEMPPGNLTYLIGYKRVQNGVFQGP